MAPAVTLCGPLVELVMPELRVCPGARPPVRLIVPLVLMVWLLPGEAPFAKRPAICAFAAGPTMLIEPDWPGRPAVTIWLAPKAFDLPMAFALPKVIAFAPVPVIEIVWAPAADMKAAPASPFTLM